MKTIIALATTAVVLASCGKGEKEYDATGTFEATEVTVSAEITGQLLRFDIEEGSEVKSGITLGNIDDVTLQLKKKELASMGEQLKAQARSIAASKGATDSRQLDLNRQMAAQQQQLSNLRRERQRFAELVKDGAVARKQLDEIDYQIKVQEKQITATAEQLNSNNASLSKQGVSAEAQIKGVEAQLESIALQQAQLDEQIGNALVTSPISGVVLKKYAENGEFVTTGKPLFKVADTDHLMIRAYVTSGQLKDIKVGQKATVYADYGNGERKAYDGKVTWISSRSEFTPKTILTDDERADLVYAVKIAVKNDGYIKIGMYGEVKFDL